MSGLAAIYVRQSLDHIEGIDRAIARCESLVKAREWTLVETYADNAVSASKSRASARWADLLRDVKAGRVEYVVGVDMDRLVRSIRDLADLSDAGAKVLTVDGDIDLTTADGEFRATMLAGIARFEVRRKAERQLRANQDAVARGLPVAGKRRLGYLPADRSTGRKVNTKLDPDEAPRVQALFEAVENGQSLTSLSREWGKLVVALRKILTNRAYIGEIPCGVYEDGKLIRTDWFPASDEVERLIDVDTFEAVQAILTAPDRKVSPGPERRHPLSGIMKCGLCGEPVKLAHGGYGCRADGSHPHVRQHIADERVKGDALGVILALDEPTDTTEVRALVLEREAHMKRRAAFSEQATWEGADVDDLRKKVAAEGRSIAALTARIDAARIQTVSGGILLRLRTEMDALAGDHSLEADEELSRLWDELWQNLPLSDKREVLHHLDIRLYPGQGGDRITVEPISSR